jgi:hypothetical protein
LSGPGEQAKANVAKENENKISKCIYLFSSKIEINCYSK